MTKKKLITAVLFFALLAGACSASNQGSNRSPAEDSTAPESTSLSPSSSAAPTAEPERTITVTRLDGTQEEVPYRITGYASLLEQHLESGLWTESEGLITLLKLFSGEIKRSEIPDAQYLVTRGGTGIVRLAYEYLAREDADPEAAAEMDRLLAQLFPSQETLAEISRPAEPTRSSRSPHLGAPNPQASPGTCQRLASSGFDSRYFSEENCYIYQEVKVGSYFYRVYYPAWWQGEDQEQLVDAALEALEHSAETYKTLGDMKDINLLFSLLPDPDDPPGDVSAGVQQPAGKFSACQLTLFPAADNSGLKTFQQTIAHEAFHCFQDWNFSSSGYEANAWWLEGSAEYFSNVAYPDVNSEHGWLGDFDRNSVNNSLLEMEYENFLFFQYAGNRYGNAGTIELLKKLAAGSGSASALANFSDMETVFQEFVVAYMSRGITDSDGKSIRVVNPAVIRKEPIDKEGEESFQVSAFVAGRFTLAYKQEKRFLEQTEGSGEGKHSAAKFKERQDPGKWSDIPPEIRSTCKDDLLYSLVVTTVKPGNTYTQEITVDKVENAECDPCLLGTWQVDNNSFEAFVRRSLTQAGGISGLPSGAIPTFDVRGSQLIEFREEGDLLTRRVGFEIEVGASGYPSFVTTVNAQGSGIYSSDGEELEIYNLMDYVSRARATMDGVDISVNLTPVGTTYNFFGQTGTGPGAGGQTNLQETGGAYTCSEDAFTFTQEGLGEMLFLRVDKILPTPVPTASP